MRRGFGEQTQLVTLWGRLAKQRGGNAEAWSLNGIGSRSRAEGSLPAKGERTWGERRGCANKEKQGWGGLGSGGGRWAEQEGGRGCAWARRPGAGMETRNGFRDPPPHGGKALSASMAHGHTHAQGQPRSQSQPPLQPGSLLSSHYYSPTPLPPQDGDPAHQNRLRTPSPCPPGQADRGTCSATGHF